MSLVVGIAVVGSCHRLLLALLLLTSPLVVGIAAVDRMVRMGRRGVRMGERKTILEEKATSQSLNF